MSTCRLIIVFLAAWQSFLAVAPTNPYYFVAPDAAGLLPFTAEELLLLKKRKILSVSETGEAAHGGFYTTVHYLDTAGRVQKTEERWPDGRREMTRNTIYQYNTAGLLVCRRINGYRQEMVDSIAYDSLGRMTYYYARIFETGKRKRDDYLHIDFDMRLSSVAGDYYVLTDRSDGGFVQRYWLDKQNQVVRVERYDRVDTVIWEKQGGKTMEQRRFKKHGETKWQAGETYEYNGNLLMVQSRYDMLYEDGFVSKLYYFYDDEGKLLRTEYQNKHAEKYFYTYGYTGLPEAEIYLDNHHVHVKRFDYKYK